VSARGGIAAGLVAVAVAAVGTPALAQAPERALLVYTAGAAGGHDELFTIRSDGSGRRRLTGTAGLQRAGVASASQPAWSPDGTQIAFLREDRNGGRVAVVDANGGGERSLTSRGFSSDPSWAPDGSRIAYVESTGMTGGVSMGGPSIFAVPAAGGDPVRLTRGTRTQFDQDPAWSPDGTRIAFTRLQVDEQGDVSAGDVYVMNADGGDQRLLVADARSPAWSPDGTRIAFATARDRNGRTCFAECTPNAEIYVANADGTAVTRVTDTTTHEGDPAWSPDGARIAFHSDFNSPQSGAGGGTELYSVGADGSCMTWLTNGSALSFDPAWQPGGGRATDPGPGCGGVARAPTFDITFPRGFRAFPVFSLGRSHQGRLLSSASPRAGTYGDCGRFDAGDCGRPVDVQSSSVCVIHPFRFGRDFGTSIERTVATRRFVHRGALVLYYPAARGWDVYTGASTVSIYGPPSRPAAIKRVVNALRRVGGRRPRRLAEPVFPASFWRMVRRFTRTRGRLGSVEATARALDVPVRVVRDKLALARLLESSEIDGRTRCPTR
jgi:Tol biopolymer transport system component